jgi:hypothetical protein
MAEVAVYNKALEGDKALKGEPEDIISIIFPPYNKKRQIEVAKAAYLRIEDEDFYNVTNFSAEVPAGSEVEVIRGKGVKFIEVQDQ